MIANYVRIFEDGLFEFFLGFCEVFYCCCCFLEVVGVSGFYCGGLWPVFEGVGYLVGWVVWCFVWDVGFGVVYAYFECEVGVD